MSETNAAWNLAPGDDRQFAKSSFTIEEGQYAEISAFGLCKDEKIVIVKIIRPPVCTDLNTVGIINKGCCGKKQALTADNQIGTIGQFGEYVIAREIHGTTMKILAPNADARVNKFTLKKGIAPMADTGFCPC